MTDTKRKADRFSADVQKIRMKHKLYDCTPQVRALHDDLVAYVRRVDRAAYNLGVADEAKKWADSLEAKRRRR